MAISGRRLALSASPPMLQQDDPGTVPPPGGRTGDINLDNILKLIPGEVIAPFMTGAGLTVSLSPSRPWLWPLVVFVVCFLTCGFLRAAATRPAGATGWLEGVNWPLVGVSLVAFFIWSHAVSGSLPLTQYVPSPAWSFFALIWGVLAPKLVPAD